MINCLVIGQGIAGSLLAWNFHKRNIPFHIVDANENFTSTKVAAGVVIPITGRRIVKTFLVDTAAPFAKQTYREIGDQLGDDYFISKEILQVFTSPGNKNDWFARSADPELQNYLGRVIDKAEMPNGIQNDFGGIILNSGGYLNTRKFLSAMALLFSENGNISFSNFSTDELEITPKYLAWNNKQFSHIIFCDGFAGTKNTFFHYLPFNPAKGEILDFECNELTDEFIINHNVYIIPQGNGKFKAGATYTWKELNTVPTTEARQFLESGIKSAINVPFTVTGHSAAVRPAVKDRRPFLGLHPKFKNIGIFNGLGAKGSLLAPYYANQFVEFLLGKGDLDAEVNINRYELLCQ